MGDRATFRDRSREEFASFKGIQILARKNLASDRVELKYKFAFGERQETKTVEMVKIEGAWKSGQTRAWDASWDDGTCALRLNRSAQRPEAVPGFVAGSPPDVIDGRAKRSPVRRATLAQGPRSSQLKRNGLSPHSS
jgi:hypothetical protein